MIISLIVAASSNNAIGKNNQLLWHLPNDLKNFKNTTWAMPVIMGRKTFESLNGKVLPGRVNIIITRQHHWTASKAITVHSLLDAIQYAKAQHFNEIFIVGGGEIYEQALAIADKIYLTRVHANVEADTFFPEINAHVWQLVSTKEFSADAKHVYPYSFQIWRKQ